MADRTNYRRARRRRCMRQRGGYSIAALLLLTAAVGLLLGLAPELFRIPGDRAGMAMLNGLAGFLGGGLVGGLIGFSYENRGQGLLLGAFIGALSGAAGAVTLVAGINLMVALVGSVAMVCVGLAVRFGSLTEGAISRSVVLGAPQMVKLSMAALAIVFTVITAVQLAIKVAAWEFPHGAAIELTMHALLLTFCLGLSIGLLQSTFRRRKTGDVTTP